MYCRVVDGQPDGLINIPMGEYRYEIQEWQGLEMRDRMLLSYDPATDTVTATYSAPDLGALKQQKVDLFYALAATEVDQVTPGYSSREVATFLLKEGEAIAYLASDPRNPALAPWLAELAAGRGIELESIAQLVVTRAPAIRSGMVAIEIKRGLYCDAVAAGATVEEVEAITWDQPLPRS